MANTRISATSTLTAREQMSIASYRQHMVEQLFSAMLSTRLGEISQAPNAPFLRAHVDRDLVVPTIEVTSLDALVAKGSVARGLSDARRYERALAKSLRKVRYATLVPALPPSTARMIRCPRHGADQGQDVVYR